MRILYLHIFLLCGMLVRTQVLISVFRDTAEVLVYEGGDEFNDAHLDEMKWKNGLGGRRVLMVQDLAFEPENVRLQNGIVWFTAKQKDTTYTLFDYEVDSNNLRKRDLRMQNNRFKIKYSVGGIVTREKYHYGLYELRFKVEEAKGIWPAFWFYGGNKNEEIDVFELKGERNNEIHVDTHCPSGCAHGYRKTPLSFGRSFGSWMKVSEYLHAGFNTMMLDWRKDELFWYINGYPMAYFRGEFPNPMNIFLNTSVAMTGEAFSPGPDSTTKWPNHYQVDYLRIWKTAGSAGGLLSQKLEESSVLVDSLIAKPVKKRGVAYRKRKLKPMEGFIHITRLSDNELKVQISGPLAAQPGKITLSGSRTRTELIYQDKEKVISIDPGERSLDLHFTSSCRQFHRKVLLNAPGR